MGQGWFEQRITPWEVMKSDINFISMELQVEGQMERKNREEFRSLFIR